jgi:hypothetical protein
LGGDAARPETPGRGRSPARRAGAARLGAAPRGHAQLAVSTMDGAHAAGLARAMGVNDAANLDRATVRDFGQSRLENSNSPAIRAVVADVVWAFRIGALCFGSEAARLRQAFLPWTTA